MVRIKVYKASRLAVIAAAVLLAAALAVLVILQLTGGRKEKDRGTMRSQVEAAAQVVAAFSVSQGPIMPPIEDEHTDSEANEIIIEILGGGEPSSGATSPPKKNRARVLIYHTHTHEAYEQVGSDPYDETETWRTADQSHSVVRVGEALSELLRAQGMEVVHDTTDHEPPRLNTAYARSLKTLEGYAGEAFDLYIDLHRDAWNASMAERAQINGREMAQLMVLIGNGGDYEVKPDYEANLAFALRLTERVNQLAPGLGREVMVKNGRYNQHMNTPSVLIEVGHNKNTLEEALAAMPVLADALGEMLP